MHNIIDEDIIDEDIDDIIDEDIIYIIDDIIDEEDHRLRTWLYRSNIIIVQTRLNVITSITGDN